MKQNGLTTFSKAPFTSNRKLIGEELIIPTKIYVNDLLPLVRKNLINSMAHITGGGILENLSRSIPRGLVAVIETKGFKIPKRFLWLKGLSKCSELEMLKTFNCGIGMILVVSKHNSEKVQEYLKKNNVKSYFLGNVNKRTKKASNVKIKMFGEWCLT